MVSLWDDDVFLGVRTFPQIIRNWQLTLMAALWIFKKLFHMTQHTHRWLNSLLRLFSLTPSYCTGSLFAVLSFSMGYVIRYATYPPDNCCPLLLLLGVWRFFYVPAGGHVTCQHWKTSLEGSKTNRFNWAYTSLWNWTLFALFIKKWWK